MRYGEKRDIVEREIVELLRRSGYLVLRSREIDLIVSRPGWAFAMLLEVKSHRRSRLTSTQKARIGEGWPVYVVTSAEEALRVVGNVRGGRA